MYQKLIDYFKDKSVLILGFGREGKTTYDFLRKYYPEKIIGIADKRNMEIDDSNVRLFTGEGYLDHIKDFDIVMQSPGISLRSVTVPENTEITGQMDLFLRFAPCFKIGITGSKGKTTTTTLIYNVVKASGRKCCLIGNIGVPVFESLNDINSTVAVIEMSCHQLEFSTASPDIAVMTNVYPEHLDHYNGFAGYVAAKCHIFDYQNESNYFIFNSDQQEMKDLIDFNSIKSVLVPVSCYLGDEDEYYKSLTVLNDNLKGYHSFQDIFFAAKVAECMGIEKDAVIRGIKDFEGIEHRLEEVGTYKGITFYNDSIATIPHAVMCGVKALGNVDTLIFGGLDRGIDYSGFIEDLNKSSISNLIGLPETGEKIIKELEKIGSDKNMFIVDTMDEAVEKSYQVTEKGKICLFSPAASSYNRYKNFEEKGRHFKKLCKEYSLL